ncbi:VOC family protein [Nesterenkonia muleiensis]|uniref:VOC family protein n=1 Tax=Nesterenkonia muleiensis TaxID=2282648 RepID=UPI000E70F27B|nr:VOC family protein [Nesterenkonia muleiensis]
MAFGFTPYLMFPGTARAAMTYYADIFGGELDLLTYGEGMGEEGETKDRIMHSSLYLERGAHLMGADLFPGQPTNGLGTTALSASDDDQEENARLASWWEKFAPDSEVIVPLDTAPWEPDSKYGHLRDRFGAEWMFMVGPTE